MMLIIGPFNGPLTLLLDPASTALSAGNPCILKLAKPSGSSTFAKWQDL
jgi:aldehyde dehydrogenase (NAD+)